MNNSVDQVPIARHMKRHPFRQLVPAVVDHPTPAQHGTRPSSTNPKTVDPRRKNRLVALAVVLLVVLSVPALILALLFAG